MVKRALDFIFAGLGLVLISPVLLAVTIMVAVKLGRPVIFSQLRPGLRGRVFRLYKFRTMKNVDASRGLSTDGQRLTPFGVKLRSTSLDELPSLLNVLRGDMSFVGPRPLLVEYVKRYSPRQARRHEVRPGVTGLAQVSGRNSLGWDEKFELDVQYVDERSLLLDLKILIRTVRSVFQREGISAEGHVTMGEFLGNPIEGSGHK